MFPEKDWSGTQTCFCDCFTFKLMSEKWTKGSFNLLGNFKSEELRLNPAVQKTLTVRSKQSQDRRLWWSVDSKCSRTCQQRTQQRQTCSETDGVLTLQSTVVGPLLEEDHVNPRQDKRPLFGSGCDSCAKPDLRC